MDTAQINLARKWRPKIFSEIVGQDLVVRMLKNSLYARHFFPVYMFSGQRGCGKTTTARIFAGAINCFRLDDFCKDPKRIIVPCLTCDSCKAMAKGSHPDFIEIDAASYTGVDNVRQIIEASALLPSLGKKKIYLIDEAHMLSKAAFNAFLKILEDPPQSVLFMLATTDPHKVLGTVRSRCFHLFFPAVAIEALVYHLQHIGKQENITADNDAFSLICREAQGSVRDALNLLEQVRFAHARVTKDVVLAAFGRMPEPHLFKLLTLIFEKNVQALLTWMQTLPLIDYDAQAIWYGLQECMRVGIYRKSGIKYQVDIQDTKTFDHIICNTSIELLSSAIYQLYEHEQIFLRTARQHMFIEILFARMCGVSNGLSPLHKISQQIPQQTTVSSQSISTSAGSSLKERSINDARWHAFVCDIERLEDPLLQSIFKQAMIISIDEKNKEIQAQFSCDVGFFSQWLDEAHKQWQPILDTAFGCPMIFKPLFSQTKPKEPEKEKSLSNAPAETSHYKDQSEGSAKPLSYKFQQQAKDSLQKGVRIDISDETTWRIANQLQKLFGGDVIEVPSL